MIKTNQIKDNIAENFKFVHAINKDIDSNDWAICLSENTKC